MNTEDALRFVGQMADTMGKPTAHRKKVYRRLMRELGAERPKVAQGQAVKRKAKRKQQKSSRRANRG